MMKLRVAALLFAAAVISTSSVRAEGNAADVTDMQALRSAVRTDKKAFVASVLELTDAEAKKFWPLYDAYQRALDMTGHQRNVRVIEVVGQNKPLSDLHAKAIAKDFISAAETEFRAHRRLYNGVMRALPAKKAVRYLQLEGKIRAVQAYDFAETIPLVK
jgi:Spy/CpxP family protein refolding chaperone